MKKNRLLEIYKNKSAPVFSLEVFPPKTQEGIEHLLQELSVLKKFDPGFVSVTYGAGGSTQGRSLQVLERINNELKLNLLPHLTCIGSSPESITQFLNLIKKMNIVNIMALRGDYPKDNPDYRPESNFFGHASDLVSFVRSNADFSMAVAGYPEKHPEAVSLSEDLANLKKKVEAGAEVIITQLFLDNQDYYKFVAAARKIGISVPIIPGIMPATSLSRIEKMTSMCGARIPRELQRSLSSAADEQAAEQIGIAHAVQQIQELINFGAEGIHLYTLNKAGIIAQILTRVLA